MALQAFKRNLRDHFAGAALGVLAAIPLLPLIHKFAEWSGPSQLNSHLEGALGLAAIYFGYDLISRGCAVRRVGMENLRVDVREEKSVEPLPSMIGERMPDGTVFAGISPDTGEAMYTTPADAPLTYTFSQAWQYASRLDAHGHHDWRPPRPGELNELFRNRAAIGGFDESGSYWGREQTFFMAAAQDFGNGDSGCHFDWDHSSLRCVRG